MRFYLKYMHKNCLKYTVYVENKFPYLYAIKYENVKGMRTKQSALIMA